MNKKVVRLSLAIAVLSAGALPLSARPNRWAQNGALDVFYAPSGEQGLLSLSFIHAAIGYSNGVYGHDYSAVGFAPLSFLEFSTAVYADGFRNDDYHYRIGPIMLSPGLKGGYSFYIGTEKKFFIAPGLVTLGRFATASSWSGDSTTVPDPPPWLDVSGILGFGYDIVELHLNAGYGIGFEPTGTSSLIPWGLALQVSPIEILDLALEVTNRAPTDDILSIDALEITPLVRMSIVPLVGVTFDLAGHIGIGSAVDPWKIELGISAAFDIVKPPGEPIARLLGRVVDEETAKPLAAKLVFPEAGIEPVITDSVTGDYWVELAPGVYRVRAESPGYKWKEKGIVLQDKDEKMLDFALAKAAEPEAYVSGTVVDKSNARPLEGVLVSFDKAGTPEVATDVLGIYKAVLQPGEYQLTFSKEGYEPEKRSVSLKDRETTELNVSLSPPTPEVMPEFKNVLFTPGSAIIMPESYAVLEEVASFLEAYPTVRIEIGGHTDSVGDDDANMRLSQQRADAVKTWLVATGIESSRLMARGYGETQPIADNRTRSGQQANRRIQFVILQD